MLHPSYNDLMNVVNSDVEPGEHPVVNSRYSIVLATAKRARQLIAGSQPLVSGKYPKPLSIAIKELSTSAIKIDTEEEARAKREAADLLQSRPLQQQKPQILTSRNKRLQRKLQQKKRIPKLK